MKNRIARLHKLNIVLIAIAIIAASALTAGFQGHQEQKAYNEAGGEIVTIFDDKISEQELSDLVNHYNGQLEIVKHIDEYALLSVKNSSYFNNILHNLKKEPKVSEAQANSALSTLSFSNDTYADAQWAIDNPGHYIYLSEAGRKDREAVADMDMDVVEAWKALSDIPPAREVVVAVIDTGVDYSHPDLKDHMWTNEGEIPGDNIDNDNNGYVDDVYGWDFYNDDATVCHYSYSDRLKMYVSSPEDNDDHGTHVAGIIGAALNNGMGVAGIASKIDVKIMALKINGGPKGTGSLASAVEAVKYATRMGADICNLSWGTTSYTAALKRVMKESDMLFVAAAGNTGDNNNEEPIYPASLSLDNLISVTFVDSAGELTGLSNYGQNAVDIAAPGEDILSTIVGNYASMSGSSMAAPQVSAVAALLYACNENIYPANVKDIILTNRKEIPSLNEYLRFGGMPSAYRALLASATLTKDTEAPIINFDTIYKNGSMVIPVKAVDAGPSGLRVLRWSLGVKSAAEFARGIIGSTVEDNQITVSKAGTYSFYASDYAGNEMVQVYEVMEDKLAPVINTTFTVSDTYKSRTVTVRATDTQSGVKRLEYLSGKRKAEEFLPGNVGTVLNEENGKVKFKVKKDGVYTVFAIDNRGNMSVKTVTIRTVKAQMLQLSQFDRLMTVDDTYTLRAYITPGSSTDHISFTSSDETIATVSTSGKITTHAPGSVIITVRTSSGLKSTCKITVIDKSSA